MSDTDRLRRLRAAVLANRVPRHLIDLFLHLMEDDDDDEIGAVERATPAERLAEQLGDEIDHAMTRCGLTHRSIAVSRRTLSRALRGDNVTLVTVAEIAAALNCDVSIAFQDRGVSGATGATDGPTAPAEAMIGDKESS